MSCCPRNLYCVNYSSLLGRSPAWQSGQRIGSTFKWLSLLAVMMGRSTLSFCNMQYVTRKNRHGNKNKNLSISKIQWMYVLLFLFLLFSLAWQLDYHSTPPHVEHTLDGDTSSDDNNSCKGNSQTEGMKHNSSTSTSSGKNSSLDCISAPSHQLSTSKKVQSGHILSDKGSSDNQHSQGHGADLDDALDSPPPHKQGTRGHVAKGKKQL